MAALDQRQHRGWDILRLSTDEVSLDVVPGLGGTITSLTRTRDTAELLWSTPWGLRHAGAYALPGSSEATMIDTFPGGWQTLFPNGGDSATVHGVEWGFDGEARVCWLDWESTGASLIMKGRLTRSPFEISKIISLRGRELTVGETVRNVGGEQIEVMWGSQLCLGGALLGPDTVVDAAASVVHPDPQISYSFNYDDVMPWPRSHGVDSVINLRNLPESGAGLTRLAYLTEFSRPWIRVARPALGLGLDLEWDIDCWPYVWYSMEAGGRAGFPWYRDGYFLALTPCTSWPAHGVHDARRISGTTWWIEPGAARTSHLTVSVHP